MDYERIYNELVEKRSKTPAKGVKERHHIVPRCLGGNDSKDNLVDLTPREHYVAHWLLTKMYPLNRKLVYAFFCMLRGRGFNSHYYDRAKRAFVEEQRSSFTKNNPMFSEAAKQKHSARMKASNPNCGGEHNSNAKPVTVIMQDGSSVEYSHGIEAYTRLGIPRSTWVRASRLGTPIPKFNVKEIIK